MQSCHTVLYLTIFRFRFYVVSDNEKEALSTCGKKPECQGVLSIHCSSAGTPCL